MLYPIIYSSFNYDEKKIFPSSPHSRTRTSIGVFLNGNKSYSSAQ